MTQQEHYRTRIAAAALDADGPAYQIRDSGLMRAFENLQSIPPQLLAEGYLGRVVHGEQLTMVVFEVEPGAVLPEHRYVNEQFGMVIEGSVSFRVGPHLWSRGSGRG